MPVAECQEGHCDRPVFGLSGSPALSVEMSALPRLADVIGVASYFRTAPIADQTIFPKKIITQRPLCKPRMRTIDTYRKFSFISKFTFRNIVNVGQAQEANLKNSCDVFQT